MVASSFNWIADLGETVHDALVSLGAFTVFVGRLWYWLLVSVPRWDTLMPNLYQVGVRSLPVVALTGTFIGMVLSVQSYAQFRQLGLETRLGAVINLSLVRELGPVLAATMLAGRVGSAMAAELGTMRVTEQIDALSVMGVNPIKYLVVPRFLACFFMIPILTIMADFMGVCGGFFYSVIVLGIDKFHYLENSAVFVTGFDLISGIAKSVFFGGAIALVSCYQGFNSEGGAEGVGKAATSSFVYSFVGILILDLFLGIAIQNLQSFLYPGGTKLL
ncbi:MAG: ABC transporter permease [Planctomycetaceae bacterium]|nr:ABC transporter permease [Planctomycetaceae bacterium]